MADMVRAAKVAPVCACGCGRPIPRYYVYDGRKKRRKWFSRKCCARARNKHKGPFPIVTCLCGCGRSFPNRNVKGKERRWFSGACAAGGKKRLSAKAWAAKCERERVRRTKRAGRICEYCGCTDRDGKWGTSATACERCRRQRSKHKCSLCGGPFYIYAHKPSGRPAGCVARCGG